MTLLAPLAALPYLPGQAGVLRDEIARRWSARAGAAPIRLVAAGLLLGASSLLVSDPRASRNSDTSIEIAARLAPVGTVNVAPGSPIAANDA